MEKRILCSSVKNRKNEPVKMCSEQSTYFVHSLRSKETAIDETRVALLTTLKMAQTTLAMLVTGVRLSRMTSEQPTTPIDILSYLCRSSLDEDDEFLISKICVVFRQLADSDKAVFFKLIPVFCNNRKRLVTPLQLAALCDNSVMFRAILAEIYRIIENPQASPLSVQMELYSEAARSTIIRLSPLHLVVLNANDSLVRHVLSQCLCNDKTARAVARSEHTLVFAVKEAKTTMERHTEGRHAETFKRVVSRLKNISTHLSTFYARVSRETDRGRRSAVVDQLLLAAASSFYSSPIRHVPSPTHPHSPYAERCS